MSLSDETGVSSRAGAAPRTGRRRRCERSGTRGGRRAMHGRWTNDRETARSTSARGGYSRRPPGGTARRRRPVHGERDESGERPRGDALPAAGRRPAVRRARCRSSSLAVVCGGYAVGAALGWGSPEVAAVHGRLRAQRRGAWSPPSPAVCYARKRRSRFRPAWLLFAASSAMAGARQRRMGLVRGRAAAARCPAPRSPTSASCCSRRPPSSACWCSPSGPVTRAGWVCLGLDAWLIGGSLLTLSWSLALAHTAHWPGRAAWPRAALVARLPAAGHRAGQHGARAALPALLGAPLGRSTPPSARSR